jgi:hypothetical protein
MFRFSIRDVLWLTVVAALACALAMTTPTIAHLHATVSSLKKAVRDKSAELRNREYESAAYRFELEKALGKSVYGHDLKPEPGKPGYVRYRIHYGDLVPGLPAEPIGSGVFLTGAD